MTTADADASTAKSIHLPRVLRVTLRNFSLYDNRAVVTADFGQGVFCLAGANGLGKSTFLAALNFGMTGIVANPDQKFESYAEYYEHSKAYSASYFRGRISENDRDAAEIELEMQVGNRRYRIVRSMFEPTGLRELSVDPPTDKKSSQPINDVTTNNEQRHRYYVKNIVADTGLDGFAQLVFLQHFVLTFDERRKLIFWDDDITQAALFLAFGLSRETADKADNLRRTAERADSLVRNLQWQATELRGRLRDIEAKAQTQEAAAEGQDTAEQHRALIGDHEALSAEVERLEMDLNDSKLRLASSTAQHQVLKAEYDRVFRERHRGIAYPLSHSVIVSTLESSHCAICGTSGPHVSAKVQADLDREECPLCGTLLSERAAEDDVSLDVLRELDSQISICAAQVNEHQLAVDRILKTLTGYEPKMRELAEGLAEFERANELALLSTNGRSNAVQGILDQYRSQISDLTERKERERRRRNSARSELKILQRELAEAFARVQDEFVPRFNMLANEFLGLDLDIAFEMLSTKVRLVLAVQSTRRRAQNTLSESQRLFIDIALRMALAQQMSAPGSEPSLFIDTPEGSLDIAYESRAGSMFGRFVKAGHQLIMTANINSSQLLLKLAATCGSDLMVLMRMTDWTSLSDVQIEEEQLFDDAYARIEEALVAGDER